MSEAPGFHCVRCAATFPRYAPSCGACGKEGSLRSNASTVREGRPRSAPLAPSTEPVERVKTGLGVLDRALGGGFPLGYTFVLTGNPGAGKTTLGLLIAEALLPLGVLYGVTEGGPEYFAELCRRTGHGVGVPMVYTRTLRHYLMEAETVGARVLVLDQLHTLEPRHRAHEHLGELQQWGQANHATVLVIGEESLAGTIRGGFGLTYASDAHIRLEKPSLERGESPPSSDAANDTESESEMQPRWIVTNKNRFGREGRWKLLLGPHGWLECPVTGAS